MPTSAASDGRDLRGAPLEEEVLRALRVDATTGLSAAEAAERLRQHGPNEIAERRPHPAREFLKKFWGLSAWMLELIIGMSWALGRYADSVIVSALLVVNAVVSLVQERRASGWSGGAHRRVAAWR